ncbi:MAG: hypothetical protein ABIP53_00765 [Candidatus Limnocylindrales bacterium]
MRPFRVVIATVLALIGLFWIGQGIGMIPGSVMSGSSFWATVGVILLVIAVAVLTREWVSQRSSRP